MRVFKGSAVCAALMMMSAAAFAQDANAPGLTGQFRATAVQAGTTACLKLKDDQRAAFLAPGLIDRSCECVANKLADRISMSDATTLMMLAMGGPQPEAAQMERIQTVLLGSVAVCIQELNLAAPPN
ncbi:hypothetical protein [Terrihabitans sp. B22-R8]|uniref:hypothetical protein n=1 Tax=Terrihabitans sp. B22-R8 TaxID=3425128 RepID=UPI00403C7B3B